MANEKHNQRRHRPATNKPGAGRGAAGAAGRRRSASGRPTRPPGTKKRRRRRGNMILYYILLLVVMLSIGIALSLTVFFGIESVVITGTDKYTQENLVQATGVTLGDNLFRIDKETIAKNLLAFPYIEQVKISRGFPPQVLVEVTQAHAMAALKEGESYRLLSDQGRVLEAGLGQAPEDLLVVTGFGEAPQTGDTVGDEGRENLIMIQYLIKAVADTGFEGVQELDLSDRLNMVVNYENRIRIELGSEGELDYKLRFARTVIDEQLEPDFTGIVDVSTIGKVWTRPLDVFE